MSFKIFACLASVFAGLSVILGAFAAHALKAKVEPYYLEVFETASRYQMYHALALFVVAFLLRGNPSFLLQLAGILFIAGIFLFSGSLYALVFTKIKALGAITPLGGMSFILAWGLLAYSVLKIEA